MKIKNTLILVAIFAGLLAYVYFYEIKGGEKRKAQQEKAKKVMVFSKEDVENLKLAHSGETIECQKQGEQWKIVQPIVTDADKSAVERVVSSLERAQIERVIVENPENLADYGLDPPQVVIELTFANGNSDTLYLGDKNPTGSQVFAKLSNSNKVFNTHHSLLNNCKKTVFDLRDKTVLEFEKEKVNKFTLSYKGKIIRCSRNGNIWEIDQPIKTRADKLEIDKIFNKVKNSKAKKFVSEKALHLGKYGLSRPHIQLDLYLGASNAKKTLVIGKKEKSLCYAKDESRDPIFLVDTLLVKELQKSVFDLRDKTVVAFKRDEVNKIVLDYVDSLFVCVKDTSGVWTLTEPKKSKAKSWKMSSILSTLSYLKAKEFVTDHPTKLSQYGLDRPQIKVTLKQNHKELATLLVGKKARHRDQVYVKTKSADTVYLVDDHIIKDLTFKFDDLAEKD